METVCALDENGKKITTAGEGDLAKCLRHELDRLDGILFVDHMIEEEQEILADLRNF